MVDTLYGTVSAVLVEGNYRHYFLTHSALSSREHYVKVEKVVN